MVGSAKHVSVARARAPRGAAVQHCLEDLGSEHIDFELEGDAPSVVQFESVIPKAAPGVAYTLIDLDGQVNIVVNVPPKVYKLVCFEVNQARCLHADCGGRLRHPLRA